MEKNKFGRTASGKQAWLYTIKNQNGMEIALTDYGARLVSVKLNGRKNKRYDVVHHSYFNLDGHDSGNVYKNKLKIYASEYSPIDEWSIPTGIYESVKNTPMDFSVWKKIGKDIENDYEQLNLTKGYNHNYILEKKGTGLAAEAEGNQSGIKMEVYTDLPGLQLYTGSYIEKVVGKGGVIYSQAQGFCLEAQYVPNAVNEKMEIKPIFEAGSSYIKYVSYKFF